MVEWSEFQKSTNFYVLISPISSNKYALGSGAEWWNGPSSRGFLVAPSLVNLPSGREEPVIYDIHVHNSIQLLEFTIPPLLFVSHKSKTSDWSRALNAGPLVKTRPLVDLCKLKLVQSSMSHTAWALEGHEGQSQEAKTAFSLKSSSIYIFLACTFERWQFLVNLLDGKEKDDVILVKRKTCCSGDCCQSQGRT